VSQPASQQASERLAEFRFDTYFGEHLFTINDGVKYDNP
jgi:hypothetical protein